jgi:GSH-dependent disulfide-bond oxidoreductase
MLRFYFSGAPNPTKVALFLEEAGLVYEAIPVDTRKGEQHKPEYLAINPNAKVPAIVDGDVTVFDSNAILLYLAEKNGKFLPPKSDKLRGELLSWLMFVASGVGPYSGQSVHFRTYSPEKIDYALNRYAYEAQRDGTLRCWPRADLIDQPLEVREFRPSSVAKDRWQARGRCG